MASLLRAQKHLGALKLGSKGYFTQLFYHHLEAVDSKQEGATKVLVFNYRTTDALRNSFNALHGGAVASLLDVSSILAVKTFQREGSTPVATHINVDYLKSGKLNEDLKIQVTVLKAGKFLSFARALLFDPNGIPMAQSSVVTKNLAEIKGSFT